MGILVLRVKDQQWRITSKLESLMLMDKWLLSLVSLMVSANTLFTFNQSVIILIVTDVFLLALLGHGGARTAEYLKNNLFKNLISHDDFVSDTKKAIGMR